MPLGTLKSDEEIDCLLEELGSLNLDLPSSRATDRTDRKVGGLGTHRTSSGGAPLTMQTGHVLVSPVCFVDSSRPSTAQMMEDIERLGLEHLIESPARLEHLNSTELLENAVLEEVGSPAKQSVRVFTESSSIKLGAQVCGVYAQYPLCNFYF